MSMFNGFGFDLNALQALMQQQAQNAASQAQSKAQQSMSLRNEYLRDMNRLKEEAQRSGKQLEGAARSKGGKYVYDYLGYGGKTAGASFGGYHPQMAADLGITRGNNPSSQYYQDMIPYLDRYNQLKQSYEDRGLRFDLYGKPRYY